MPIFPAQHLVVAVVRGGVEPPTFRFSALGIPVVMLARVDAIDADIAALDGKIEEMIAPFTAAAQRLDEIPGINAVAACVILAEQPLIGAVATAVGIAVGVAASLLANSELIDGLRRQPAARNG